MDREVATAIPACLQNESKLRLHRRASRYACGQCEPLLPYAGFYQRDGLARVACLADSLRESHGVLHAFNVESEGRYTLVADNSSIMSSTARHVLIANSQHVADG